MVRPERSRLRFAASTRASRTTCQETPAHSLKIRTRRFGTPVAISTSRNVPCPCGSGKRYKQCCGELNVSADSQLQNVMYSALSQHQAGALESAETLYRR